MPSENAQPQPQSLLPSKPGIPVWSADDIDASLEAILIYVECEANKSINWYWRNKRSKAIYSQVIRFAAYTLTALGGLFPIAVLMLNPLLESLQFHYQIPDKGLASSLFVGVAAGLYGLDKAFGLSSGWTRYVLTATILERTLEEFRLQWTVLLAKLGRPPAPDQIEALLKCAQDFRVAVASAVLQETKDWVTEFQNNLGELERDTRAQLESLRATVEKNRQTGSQESRPGAIELTVTDAASAEGATFEVTLQGDKDFLLKETARNTKTWASLGLAPGQYRLTLAARVGGKDLTVTKILIIKPDETTALQTQLQV